MSYASHYAVLCLTETAYSHSAALSNNSGIPILGNSRKRNSFGGALRGIPKDDCEGDYILGGLFSGSVLNSYFAAHAFEQKDVTKLTRALAHAL